MPTIKQKLRVGVLTTHFSQGFHRIRRPLFAHLSIVDYEPRMPFRSRLYQSQPQCRVGQRLFAVRRVASR
jgi:hypothetical protein